MAIGASDWVAATSMLGLQSEMFQQPHFARAQVAIHPPHRIWVHKTANVLNKVSRSVHLNMKLDLHEIYGAPPRAAAETAAGL